MKYMERGGFQAHSLMRLTLGLTLFLLVGFWLTNFVLYFSRMGLQPSSVVAYYNGSEEVFRPPRTLGSMIEVTHGHLAVMAMVLLLLTHLAIFAPLGSVVKKSIIIGAFAAALLDEGAGWLVRFVSPAFASFKVAGFLALQSVLAALMLSLGWSLLGVSRQRPEDTEHPPFTEAAGEELLTEVSLTATSRGGRNS